LVALQQRRSVGTGWSLIGTSPVDGSILWPVDSLDRSQPNLREGYTVNP
jgi:hypothetical protein